MTAKNGHDHNDPAHRFSRLFVGNTRSSGRYDPKRDRAFTESTPLTIDDYKNHLEGVIGAGAVPIQDDDTCHWAALDVDNHDSDEDIPLRPFADKAAQLKVPLLACRSKSGGIHAYAFFEKPQPCQKVRIMMTGWALQLGVGGCEVFPKQGKLATTADNKKQLGNWLNLPYFDADETMRYAVVDGKKLSLLEFLAVAEKARISDAALRAASSAEHPEAPPCVQKMYANGVAQGQRNEALYAIGVYQRKASPGEFTARALDANQGVFSKPLARAEALRTIASAGKPDYGYRCNEEPCRSLCDRSVCLTRKFGITPADADRIDTVEALPTFSELIKYRSEPVRWEVKVDGIKVTNLETEDLLDWRVIRRVCAERLTKVVPLIKNFEWERILQPLMLSARIIDAPDEASIAGVVRERLKEFASKADLINPGQSREDRKALLRGLPIVQMVGPERCVVFRAQDFINYLKRTKSEELKGVALWFAVKDLGTGTSRMRIPGANKGEDNINVWHLPVKVVLSAEHEAEAPEFKSEL